MPPNFYWGILLTCGGAGRGQVGDMRRNRRKRARREELAKFMVAFGAGLILALFCSVRLTLFIAAAALVYFGLNSNTRC